jgi:hypothetical protein
MKREEEIKQAAQAYYPTGALHEEKAVSAFIRGAKWADETMIERVREWVKNAFTGPFGEGMANSIADEFVKKMKGE